MSFELHEECAVVAIHGHPHAATMAADCLFALQHRGQEASGILTANGKKIYCCKGLGLVREVFSENSLKKLKGDKAIGHNRYSTTGSNCKENAQPFWTESKFGAIGVAHNGNLTNTLQLRKKLLRQGVRFSGTSDSEVILHRIAQSAKPTLFLAVRGVLRELQGAFSLVLLSKDSVIAARDPYGFRPLVMGEGAVVDGKSYTAFASETCALDLLRASYLREVSPGEMIEIGPDGMKRCIFRNPQRSAQCVFEHVYFSRPDSLVFGRYVEKSRRSLGRELAKEHPEPSADMVVYVPDSGYDAARGFAEESGLPLERGLIRNHYVGRTFIQPEQIHRDIAVRLKLNPVRHLINGKSIVLVDDSIVRGTTSRKIVRMLRKAGARQVHLRIACPPTIAPCFFGTDTPSKAELIAANHSVEEICRFVEADSLGYLSLKGLAKAVENGRKYCFSCYTGKYPLPIDHLIAIQPAAKRVPH